MQLVERTFDINSYTYLEIPRFSGVLIDDVSGLLNANNKQRTLKHVAAVARTNVEIAEKYGLDAEVCMISGYLHDISAIINPADMLTFVRNNNLFFDEAERRYPFLLHQRISRLFAISLFGITEPNILSSIECHSTLKGNPSPYDMALFIADKLSWDQEGTPPYYDVVQGALDESLEIASLAYMKYIEDNKLILHPHSWFIEGKNYLEGIIHSQK